MKAEREKINAKVKADTVRLTGGKLELTADEEMCTFVLISEGSCTLQIGENSLLLNPGSALLLGAGDAVLPAAGAAVPELVGCRFPLSALHELRTQTQRDFSRLFEPEQSAVLYLSSSAGSCSLPPFRCIDTARTFALIFSCSAFIL